jgi:hypothetical protein
MDKKPSSAQIKDFGERYGNGPFAKITKPPPISAAVEFTPLTDKEGGENPSSLFGDKRNVVAEKIFQDSRGHIDTMEPSHKESREINTDGALEALSQGLGGDKVHILENDAPENDSPGSFSADDEVFKKILEHGFLDEQASIPVETNPIDAEIQKVREEMKQAAIVIKEKIEDGSLSGDKGGKIKLAAEDLSQRIEDAVNARGDMLSEEAYITGLRQLSEEIAAVGSEEWEKRFTASDTPTPALSQAEDVKTKAVRGVNETVPETKVEPQEQKPVSEDEAAALFENLPQEQKLGFWKNVAHVGFTVEQKKNELFAGAFGWLSGNEKTNDRDKTFQRFFDSTKEIFERDAKRAEQSLSDLHAGKEMRLNLFGKDIVDVQTLRGSGFLWGNIMKYGRSILGPFAWVNTGLMALNIGLEAAKEARLKNEDMIEKTRIQDIDEAAEKAWGAYEEAQKKSADGVLVTKEILEKAYQEAIPQDLLDRLAKNIEPGVENGFWQKILQKDIQHTVEKMSEELAKIDVDASLSQEEKDSRKNAYLNNWFTRSQRLKDFDRMVSQNGEVDELAALARYGEFAAKTAVYAMMADSMRRIGTKMAELFSQADTIETVASSVPLVGEGTIPAVSPVNGGNIPLETVAVSGVISHDIPAVQTPAASTRLVDELLGKINNPQHDEAVFVSKDLNAENLPVKIMPELAEKTFSTETAEAAAVPHESTGTIIPEAVKIPRETIPEPKWLAAAETLPPHHQTTIEDTLHNLGEAYTAKQGDNVWNILKGKLLGNEEFAKLEPRRQNFIIDSLKDRIVGMSEKELQGMGVRKDPNLIYPVDKINLGKVFNESEELKKIFSRAENLQPAPEVVSAPLPAPEPGGAADAVHIAADTATPTPKAPEHIIAPITETQVSIPVNPPENIPPSIQLPPPDMPYPPQYPIMHGMIPPQSQTMADIANQMTEADKGAAHYMTQMDKYAAQSMWQNDRDISEWITESDKNISQPDAILWFNAHVPRIPNPYMAPLRELPPIYPHYIQQGIYRQYPHMSSDMQSRFFGERTVNLMAKNGYEPTLNAVNNMGRVFGIEKPIQVNYQNSTETPAELLARMLCQKSQELGHLPARLPETPALIDAVNRFGTPNPANQSVVA